MTKKLSETFFSHYTVAEVKMAAVKEWGEDQLVRILDSFVFLSDLILIRSPTVRSLSIN